MVEADRRDYLPLRNYALIGDAHTAALVASDGSIDWCCFPHFDSPAVFCRLLDKSRGGWFRVGPRDRHAASRSYIDLTNVLATTFSTDDGQFRLTDLMPVEPRGAGRHGEDITSRRRILRLVEGLSGSADVEVSFRPTFDYARAQASIYVCEGGAVARGGGEALALSCPFKLEPDGAGALAGRFRISRGERVWLALSYLGDGGTQGQGFDTGGEDGELERTLGYWHEWSSRCRYDGPYREMVLRSALTLKLLTFEPTGALIAAPTTSLPEEIGGVRNWDYRYTWLRDSALILSALQLIGHYEEAVDFFEWLNGLAIAQSPRLQIMYTINGEPNIAEQTLDHLEGYRKSRPVRVGNAAFDQTQLDIYGEVLDALHFYTEQMRQPVRPEWRDEVHYLADQACRHWREPDYGIWEVRGGKRHFLYSKLLCWVALDRALSLARHLDSPEDVKRWGRTRGEIRQAILAEGYDDDIGAFTQAFGERALDASALVIPLTGFLPATDPRVLSTTERIREQLTSNGLVYRYLSDDGLPGGEGTFALCSFWLVDNLALQGRVDEARQLFERITSYASDEGLLAEEIAPASGELLGNYPQGFTHLALIRSAYHISRA
jgi:GH15 family glucan-1,4-alpha-glucosidase